jgi:hypothetical protein
MEGWRDRGSMCIYRERNKRRKDWGERGMEGYMKEGNIHIHI